MNRRRKRPNFFGWAIFALVVLFGYYFNRVYLPATPLLAGPTATPTRSPESYMTEAEKLFQEGQLEQTMNAYQAAINASPQDPAPYIALARVQVWAGLYDDAQKNAENALLLSPNNALAYGVLAWALDFQGGRNGEALEAIDKALKIDDRNAVLQAYYVEILVDAGVDNYAKASEQSRIALSLNPNIVETHRARGYLLANTASTEFTVNIEESIREYDEAIKIHPNLARLHLEQGLNYRNLSQKDKALQEFTLAITLNPTDPEPYNLISRTHATFGEYPKALQYAESAVQQSPADAKLRGNWGVMYYRNFDWANAVKQLGLAIFGGTTEEGDAITGLPLGNDPRLAEYYFTFGLALARTNRCGDALQIVQQLQSTVPNDEIAMDAANRTIEICQENLNNPAVSTSTPSSSLVETPTPAP
jgi:tetratricopeptide (TPR) repeat protein